MREILLVVVVFMIAAPVFAQTVTVSCATDGNEVTVSYDVPGGSPNNVRAFALDIDVDNGATIDSIDGYKIGESNSVSQGYGIFVGSIQISGDTVTDYDDPIPPGSDPCVAGVLGDSAITVELGSLYDDSNYAPDSNGVLFTFKVSGDCTVTISENARRGGIVMEDPNESVSPDFGSGCTVSVTDCYGDGPDRTEWEAAGSPASWCWPRQCHGDTDNALEYYGGRSGTQDNAWVGYADITELLKGFRNDTAAAAEDWSGDVDHAREWYGGRSGTQDNARVGYNDISDLLFWFRKSTDPDNNPPGDCQTATPAANE